jgi:uncharacterized protein
MSQAALTLCIFATAVLYSSVGHAGASGYLAAMAMFGVAPEYMRPATLVLNVLVASIGTFKFYRAGHFSWPVFWPIVAASVPFAFIGGWLELPDRTYKTLLGVLMILAAVRMAWKMPKHDTRPVSIPLAILCGAAIGLLSGLTGMGGSILLGPALLFMGWTSAKESFGVCAAFNLVNSLAGLAGLATKQIRYPDALPYWAVAVIIGALIGAELGSRRLRTVTLTRIAAAVLAVAGLKLIAS